MSMVHTVIARDADEQILHVIACFHERQVPIATKFIKESYPDAIISVTTRAEEPDLPDTAR